MIIMGTNTWEIDIPKKILVNQALRFADDVKSQGIAELQDFLLAHDQKLLWCTWQTNDLESLKAAFIIMNEQSGLNSVLTPVEDVFPD